MRERLRESTTLADFARDYAEAAELVRNGERGVENCRAFLYDAELARQEAYVKLERAREKLLTATAAEQRETP